jgi:hypothetical protein
METKSIKILFVLLSILSIGCTKTLRPGAYISYVQEEKNGFSKAGQAGNWSYAVQYKTAAFIYLQEKKSGQVSEEEYMKRKGELEEWIFFNVSVQHSTVKSASPLRLSSSDLGQYNILLNYYLGENRNNFKLISENKTFTPEIYLFENNYNLSPQDVFVLGFHTGKDSKPEQFTLSYNDEVLASGIIRFAFNKQDLLNEPVLSF